MKKSMIVGGLIVVLVVVLIFTFKYSGSVVSQTPQMNGHNVIHLLKERYELNEEAVKNLDNALTRLDGMIDESFNEAVSNKEVSKQEAESREMHMQRVSYLALELMMAYEKAEGVSFTRTKAEDLMLAAYLHDIRKYAEGNHAKQGANYVSEKLPTYMTIEDSSLEHIRQLIKYHSDALSDKQRTKLGEDAILVDILQDADTVEKILSRGQSVDENIEKLNLQSSRDFLVSYGIK